jgi:ligand-binding sensor domain-containing protein/signal transduction histidine kinase
MPVLRPRQRNVIVDSYSSSWRLFAIRAGQLLICALLLSGGPILAQQFPVRHYNVEDGLAHSIVGAIFQDKKGYIWFGTAGGLSRFDGYRFTNYGKDDGLPSAVVTAITEDAKGQLWIGTTGGIARLIDDPNETSPAQANAPADKRKKFVSYWIGTTDNSNAVSAVLFDKNGTLWCTSDEIYHSAPDANSQLKFEVAITHKGGWTTFRSFVDSRGRLWFGLLHELIEFVDGRVITYGTADGLPMDQSYSREAPTIFNEQIVSIAEDSQGRMYVANRRNLFEFIPSEKSNEPRGRLRKLAFSLPVDREIRALTADSQQRLCIGTTQGLFRYSTDKEGGTMAESLTDSYIIALTQDRDGNLWAGTNWGVYKSSSDFLVSFTKADGMADEDVSSIIEGPRGTIYASTQRSGVFAIRDGKVAPIKASQWSSFGQFISVLRRDRRGNYWVAARDGLYLFNGPELDFRHGKKIASGLGHAWYEDPQGRIWCGGNDPALYVLDPKQSDRSVFQRIPLDKTPKGHTLDALHCAISDRSGEMWFGWQADLGRYRNGKVELIDPPTGLAELLPRSFLMDSRGWLWIGTADSGILMTKDPAAEHPQFVSYPVGDTVWSLVEDEFGRIYFNAPKGFDRLDPATGEIHHFNRHAGVMMKDGQGSIWMSRAGGVARLNPHLEPPPVAPPPVYFSHLEVAGEELPLPERGTRQLGRLDLSANNLVIEFLSLNFQAEHEVRYQHKFEGDRDWSAPSEQRALNFERLAPGSYRLLVRAISAEGHVNDQPSVLEFRILLPLWQRWWFIALVLSLLTAGIFALYRVRIRQIVAMEKIRHQVATDLHDDVGSGLAQIAILSEVAKRDSSPATSSMLAEVAEIARSTRDSMSDLVWAIDPRKDSLVDLVQRMRQASFNLLEADGVRVDFHAPADKEIEQTGLAPDRRRHLLLIFKEAITNVARHAGASRVQVDISVAPGKLRLKISDDGGGFDLTAQGNGHGLHSLGQRAEELSAELEIESSPGKGTSVQVTVPIK